MHQALACHDIGCSQRVSNALLSGRPEAWGCLCHTACAITTVHHCSSVVLVWVMAFRCVSLVSSNYGARGFSFALGSLNLLEGPSSPDFARDRCDSSETFTSDFLHVTWETLHFPGQCVTVQGSAVVLRNLSLDNLGFETKNLYLKLSSLISKVLL